MVGALAQVYRDHARATAAQQSQARAALEAEPLVQGLMDALDARVIDGSAARSA